MEKKLAAYESPAQTSEDELIKVAFEAVRQELRDAVPVNIRPSSFRSALVNLPQDTSPGFPLTRMGYSEKRQCYGILHRMAEMKAKFSRRQKVVSPPCVAGVRNQLCPIGENKPRLTWVYPLEMTLLESIFAQPLIEALKKCTIFAWNVNWLDAGAQDLMFQIPRTHANFGFDISGFDASVSESQIRRAFKLLRSLLTLEPWQDNAWNHVVNYFIKTWVIFYEQAVQVTHGVPSGSYFTQIIDSIVNAMALFDAVQIMAKKRGFKIPGKKYATRFSDLFRYWNFLGDDSLVELRFDLYSHDNQVLADIILERNGLKIHPEKGFFCPSSSDDDDDDYPPIEFLGMKLLSAQDVVTEDERLYAQISLPETPDLDPGDLLIRLLGLAYSHGTDERQHRLILEEYRRVTSRYPGVTMQIKKGEVRDYLVYVLGLDIAKIPKEPPDYKTISTRYRGVPSLRI